MSLVLVGCILATTLFPVSAQETCTEHSVAAPSLIQRSSASGLTFSLENESAEERRTELKWLSAQGPNNASVKAKGMLELARIQASQKESNDTSGVTATAISALLSNAFICAAILGVFTFLQRHYAWVFYGNVLDATMPQEPGRYWTSFWRLNLDKVASAIGLDACMAIEYSSFGARLLLAIGMPNLLLLSPLHRWYGGGGLEQKDLLNSFSMANVRRQHPWLYHVHALVVLWTVLVVRKLVFEAQTLFVARRMTWMRELTYPRANTILVEGIPQEYRSEEQVSRFFHGILGPDSIVCTDMVKKSEQLEDVIQQRDLAKSKLEESKGCLEREGIRPELGRFQRFPQNLFYRFGADDADAIDYFSEKNAKHELQIQELREAMNSAQHKGQTDGFSTYAAFVTFKSRKHVEIAKGLEFSGCGDWVISDAPEASGIRWSDLSRGEGLSRKTVATGYILILCLFANFSPISLAISAAASDVNLGRLQPLWDAFAPTLGLTIFLSMLPTALLWIFGNFFTLRAEPFAQHRLQIWYFGFQLICILFLPIVGSDFHSFANQLFQDGTMLSVLKLLADKIPRSSQFFFSFVVLQWSVACMELLRMVVLGKFLLFRTTHSEDKAREMAEPEDQDFYGMGGRTARWSLNLVIGCVFCCVWPLVTMAALVQFLLQRAAYGYLIVFAETRKADSGGEFWVESLSQLLYSMVLFSVGMCGVLLHRSSSSIPAAVALLGGIVAAESIWQFHTDFRWRSLPIHEVLAIDQKQVPKPTESDAALYQHPALRSNAAI